jgi:hypothetical protein
LARERSASWRQRVIVPDSFGLSIENYRNSFVSPASLYFKTGRIAGDTLTDAIAGMTVAQVVAAPFYNDGYGDIPVFIVQIDSFRNGHPLMSTFIQVGDSTGEKRTISKYRSDGDIRFYDYPSTRDDAATFYPQSFIYPDTAGRLLVAPLDSIRVVDPTTGDTTILQTVINNIYNLEGGVNLYNADSVLISDRTVGGNGYGLYFDTTAYFAASTEGHFGLIPTAGNIDFSAGAAINIIANDGQVNINTKVDDIDIVAEQGAATMLSSQDASVRSLDKNVQIWSDLGYIDMRAGDSMVLGTPEVLTLDNNIQYVMGLDTTTGRWYKVDKTTFTSAVEGDTVNIYNASDTLTGTRTVEMAGYDLDFSNGTFGAFILEDNGGKSPLIQLSPFSSEGGGAVLIGNVGRSLINVADSGNIEVISITDLVFSVSDLTQLTSNEGRFFVDTMKFAAAAAPLSPTGQFVVSSEDIDLYTSGTANTSYVFMDQGRIDLYGDTIWVSDSTDMFKLPVKTTATRASAPPAGTIIFNATDTVFQGYNGQAWVNLVDSSATASTRAYGRMAKTADSVNLIVVGATPIHLTNTDRDLFAFTHNSNMVVQGDSVVISQTADYKVSYSYSAEATANTTMRFDVYKNGSSIRLGMQRTYDMSRDDKFPITGETILSLTAGDVLKPYVARTGSSSDLYIRTGTVLVEKVN